MQNPLLDKLTGELDALARQKQTCLDRAQDFQTRLKGAEEQLKQTEAQLRKARRAVLVGGKPGIPAAEERRLVQTLVELPIEQAAMEDLIAEQQAEAAQLDEAIREKEGQIEHCRLDALEVALLTNRLRLNELTRQSHAIRAEDKQHIEEWQSAEVHLRRLKAANERRWRPNEHPDVYAYARNAQPRPEEEHEKLCRERIAELEAKLQGGTQHGQATTNESGG